MFERFTRPLLIGHRGASMHAPENTLAAFDLALRVGAQILELDVHMTRDGEIVVFHDETLERTTDGHGSILDHTLAELKQLDAGYAFEAGGVFRFRDRGCRIATLREVLEMFPEAGLNIEIKQTRPSAVRPVLDLLEAVDPEQVLLVSRYPEVMREIEAAEPKCGLGLSLDQITAVIKGAYFGGVPESLRGRGMQIPLRHSRFALGLFPLTTRRVIRAAHAAGVEVHLWTIDNPRVAARWLDRGADAVMTNDPSTLHEVYVPRWGDVGPLAGAARN